MQSPDFYIIRSSLNEWFWNESLGWCAEHMAQRYTLKDVRAKMDSWHPEYFQRTKPMVVETIVLEDGTHAHAYLADEAAASASMSWDADLYFQ